MGRTRVFPNWHYVLGIASCQHCFQINLSSPAKDDPEDVPGDRCWRP